MKLAVSIFLGTVLIAQSPKEEYMEFINDFIRAPQISFDYKIVDNSSSTAQVINGFYKKNADQSILKSSDYTVLSTKQLTITVYQEEKIILLNNPSESNQLAEIGLKDFKESVSSVTEIPSSQKGIKIWEVFGVDWDGKGLIKVDQEKKIPLQIKIFLKTADRLKAKPVLEINFSNMLKEAPDKKLFDISNYVIFKGDDYHLSSKYSGYQLINNLD
jgi:hypothetical protein